jgi:MoxR-like ATPase
VLAILSIPNIYGILFIDEISNVQRDDQLTLFYSIIQEKEAGFDLVFSRNLKIILAGNTSEWSSIVRPLPEPLRNRVTIYYVKPPTPKEWIEYMMRRFGDEWEKACGVYLQLFPDDILKPPAHDEENFPSPRSWTECCKLIYELKKQGVEKEIIEATIIGRLGSEVGTKFASIFKIDVDVQQLLKTLQEDPAKFDKLDTELKILVLSILSSQPFEVLAMFRKLIEYLAEKHRELLTVLVMIINKDAKKKLLSEEWFRNIILKLSKEAAKFT